MADLILHHYAGSPFSEKVRLVLGYKGLAWHSVTVPVMMPKPDVVALTGGYRKTPFLQIGADIYCDSALMCRVIDRLHPTPSLGLGGAADIVAQWADSALFWVAVPYTLRQGAAHIFPTATPEFMQAFGADRASFTAGMRRPPAHDAQAQLQGYLQRLEDMLQTGHACLLGDAPCIADFAAAQSLWFMHLAPPVAKMLAAYPLLSAWYARMATYSSTADVRLSATDALAVSRAAASHAAVHVQAGLGFDAGTTVTVSATDYGTDPVTGTLVGLTSDSVTLARDDERAGRVHVHFPRVGFHLQA